MQKYQMKHLHSREAATGCRTSENSFLRRHALNPPLEQTFQSYQSDCWAHNLCWTGMVIPPEREVGSHKIVKSLMWFPLHSGEASQQ